MTKRIKVVFAAEGKGTLKESGDGGDREMEFTYTLDATKKPRELDVTTTENGRTEVHKGIYKLGKDGLTICFTHAPGDRPTEFASPADTPIQLIVLRRDKE